MRELTMMDCLEVSGGTNSSDNGTSAQSCKDIANGGVECATVNGNTMIVNTYDKNGNLVNISACTENSTFKIKLTIPRTGTLEGGKYHGSSCEVIRQPSQRGAPAIEDQWIVVSPFTGAP